MKPLFILAVWLYFIFEGLTEGMSTDNIKFNDKRIADKYHLLRCGENLGIIIAVHILMIAGNLKAMIPIFWLSVASGLGLYEMAFSWLKYGNPLHNKTSKWLFIPHPPGWVSYAAFIIFAGIKVCILSMDIL